MLVRDIMTREFDSLFPTSTLKEACKEMEKHDFGFLPIQENGKLFGVVTDRDIVLRAGTKGLTWDDHLDKVMSKNVITVHETDDLQFAANTMEEKHVRRLVVLDKNEKMTGVLSLGDIAFKTDETLLSGEIIHAVSETTH